MKGLYLAVIIFGLFGIEANVCPTGKPSLQGCRTHLCPSGSICYRDGALCCGDLDLFCSTKMHTYHSNKFLSYSWEFDETKAAEWYNVTLNNSVIACPLPFSYAYGENKVLPVDFEKTATTKPKACKINSDCNMENEEFCGAASNPTFNSALDKNGTNGTALDKSGPNGTALDKSGPNGTAFSFCYKFHNLGFTNIKPIIKPDEKELVGCDNNTDCAAPHGSEKFCFEYGNRSVRILKNDGKTEYNNGVCAVAHACDLLRHGYTVATLTKNNTFCTINEDCQGSANEEKHAHSMPECVGVSNLKNALMCCFRHNKDCEFGTVEYPFKTCSTFKSCNNKDLASVMDMWCDDKSKRCCKTDDTETWACPNGVTPLFNEPKCTEYVPLHIISGKCPNKAGICRRGHCCPPLFKMNASRFELGEYVYMTNFACEPYKPIPKYFNHAFCDTGESKIVIMGKLDADEDLIAEVGPDCTSNYDCPGISVCVTRTNNQRHCVWNPLLQKPIIYNMRGYWKKRLIISIACSILFLIPTVISYICHFHISLANKISCCDADSEGDSEFSVPPVPPPEEQPKNLKCYKYPPEKGSEAWAIYIISVEEKEKIAMFEEDYLRLSDESQQVVLRALKEAETGSKEKCQGNVGKRCVKPPWMMLLWDLRRNRAIINNEPLSVSEEEFIDDEIVEAEKVLRDRYARYLERLERLEESEEKARKEEKEKQARRKEEQKKNKKGKKKSEGKKKGPEAINSELSYTGGV